MAGAAGVAVGVTGTSRAVGVAGPTIAKVTLALLLLGSSPGLVVETVAVLRPSGGAARSFTRTRMRIVTSSVVGSLPIVTITVRPLLETSPRVVVASITSR